MHPLLSGKPWLAAGSYCALTRRTDAAEMNQSPQVAADAELQKHNGDDDEATVGFWVCKH